MSGVSNAVARFFLWPGIFIIDSLSLRQHALMQDTTNQNASRLVPVEHNMPAVFHTMETSANVISRPPQCRVIGEHLAARLKVVDVSNGLPLAPGAECIVYNAQEVGFGATGETNESHCLA